MLTSEGRRALSRVAARATAVHRALAPALPASAVTGTRAFLRRLLTELDRREGAEGRSAPHQEEPS